MPKSIAELTRTVFEIAFASLTGETETGEKERLEMLEELHTDFESLSEPVAADANETDVAECGLVDVVFAPTALTFADMAAADAANQTADNVRDLSRRFQTLFGNVMFSEEVEDKMTAVRGLVDELSVLMGETPTAESVAVEGTIGLHYPPDGHIYPSGDGDKWVSAPVSLDELHADGVAIEARDATEADLSEAGVQVETSENERRRSVIVDFRILKPGPGNKKHNRYYPNDVVKRDIHVFEGVDVYATDHIMKERNEETKKGKVLQCPAYFMEDGSPIARVLIYDPDQAEKTRNRADADALDTLQCSIFGKGKAAPGQVNGQRHSVVQEMTKGLYLDLVSTGGAGGQAQTLVESDSGGETMNDTEEKTTPDSDVDTTEVDIEESEAEQETDETPVMLESAAVDAVLAETNLPSAFRTALRWGDYADADALQEAIAEAIAEVKKLTGSGAVVGLGETEPPEAETWTDEEVHKRHDERVAVKFAEVGL